MKVAVIGAGLSGLSCALELARHGIVPAVFEKKSAIGRDMGLSTIILRLFSISRKDPVASIKKKYGLDLKPLSVLQRITMNSAKARTVVKSDLGYIFRRGDDPLSLESQIASQLKIPIYYDKMVCLNDIKNEFDFIVAASGEDSIPKELGVWNASLNFQTRVATVLGKFKIDRADVWFNTDFAKNGFCYLVPFSPEQAFLCLVVDNISFGELDFYWRKLLLSIDFSCDIIQTSDIEHNIGYSKPVRVGNILFAGTSAGAMDSFMGFGAFNAIESGFLAARSIINGLDYASLLRPILKDVQSVNSFRNLINTFGNSDYNRLITFIGIPMVKLLVYCNSNIRAKDFAPLAKLYASIRNKY